MRAKYEFPGGAAAFILPDGQTGVVTTGYADRDAKRLVQPGSRFLAGSVGKTFVSALTLSLACDGRLCLDDKLEKYLGKRSWFQRLPNATQITLRHLLTHSAGLIDHNESPEFFIRVHKLAADLKGHPDAYLRPEEEIQFVLDRQPLFAAGRGFNYTDTGYVLLGLVLEHVTGKTYYEELRRRFLEPFKLTLTTPSDRRGLDRLVAGYMSKYNLLGLPDKTTSAEGMLRFNPASEWTGGGLVSNPGDLVRWAQILYEGHAIAKPYLDDLLSTPVPHKSGANYYGCGVVVKGTPLGVCYGHTGWFPGYQSEMRYDPKRHVGVAIQINTDIDMRRKNISVYTSTLANALVHAFADVRNRE